MLALSVASSQKFSFILNIYKILRNIEGCGVWGCVFQGWQELPCPVADCRIRVPQTNQIRDLKKKKKKN